MPTKEQKADYYLLTMWAGAAVPNVAAGYKAVQRQFRLPAGELLPLGKVRTMVHLALKRQGWNPHDTKELIRAWLHYHRMMIKAGDIL